MKSISIILTLIGVLLSGTNCRDTTNGNVNTTDYSQPALTVDVLEFTPPSFWIVADQNYIDFVDAYTYNSFWGTKNKGIDELAVFENKLYIGIGDASYNFGGDYCPLDGRRCDVNDQPGHGIPILALSEGSTQPETEFVVQDEAITSYRVSGNKLLIPGVDASEDALLGNIYIKENGTWTKHRKLIGNLHVHDVAEFKGSLFAVGSGPIDMNGYNAGDIGATVWRSDDNGATWIVEQKYLDKPAGDCRYTSIIQLENEMIVFGSYIEGGTVLVNISQVYDGTNWTFKNIMPSSYYFGTNSYPLAGDKVFVISNTIIGSSLIRAYRFNTTTEQEIAYFADNDLRPIDAYKVNGNLMIFLVRVGQDTSNNPTDLVYSLLASSDLVNFTNVLTWTETTQYRSIAYWNDKIVLGSSEGFLYTMPLVIR